jgi:hypothetical protein
MEGFVGKGTFRLNIRKRREKHAVSAHLPAEYSEQQERLDLRWSRRSADVKVGDDDQLPEWLGR